MIEALLWGGLGGLALVIGAVIGLVARIPSRVLGLVMAFGAGVLISALAFELTLEAFELGGTAPVTIGLAAGALCFYAGNAVLEARGAGARKRAEGQMSAGMAAPGPAAALVLGALLDGIPESAVIGMSLLQGEGVAVAVLAAVFLSNLPESISSASGMRADGRSVSHVLAVWGGVMIAAAVASGLGYALLDGASENVIAGIQAFAAGAILTMLADTMMPEAFEKGGRAAGLVTVLGFALAFLLSATG